MKNEIANREIIKQAIEKGEYRKKILAQLLDVSHPTFNKFLEAHPDLEELRTQKQPHIKENGNREYNKNYHKNYKREISEERKEYQRKHKNASRAKLREERKAAKLALLVSENAVKAEKVDEGNGASNQIM